MADRPASFTADRADRVAVGQFVHTQLPLLSEDAPVDGWVEVESVSSDGVMVTLVVTGADPVTWPVNRIVYMGS